MRIFVGTYDIAGAVSNLAAGFRKLGHEVETGVWQKHSFRPDTPYDRDDLDEVRKAATYEHDEHGNMQVLNVSDDFANWMLSFDLYVFVASQSFFPANFDYPLLKAAGKKIACFMAGSEVRYWQAAEIMWKEWGAPLPESIKERRFLRFPPTLEMPLRKDVYANCIASKRHNILMAELYASVIFSVPEQSGLQSRPYQNFILPIPVKHIKENIPKRDCPLIIHIPSDKGFKRTKMIRRCLEMLAEEGLDFDVKMLHKIPHDQVLAELSNADILIDEMSHFPAVLSHEGMAAGCCVVTGNHPGVVPYPDAENCPAVHIDPACLYDQLKKVISDKKYRISQAEKGRAYAEKYASVENAAQRFLDAVERAENGDFDYYPRFAFTDMVLPEDEPYPEYLKNYALHVLKEHGIPPGTDVFDLIMKGFLPTNAHMEIPHIEAKAWDVKLRETAKWVYVQDKGQTIPSLAQPSEASVGKLPQLTEKKEMTIAKSDTCALTPLSTGPLTPPPFFIIGAGRSGTSLLRRMLMAHDDIHIPPETYVLKRIIKHFEAAQFLPWRNLVLDTLKIIEDSSGFESFDINLWKLNLRLNLLPEEERSLKAILHHFYLFHAEKVSPKATRWGDKTPINTEGLEEILTLFPEGKYINLIRDGYDYIFSYIRSGRAESIEDAAVRWTESLTKCRHYETLFPDRFLTVRYENLVTAPGKICKKVCDFIGLDFREEMLHSEDVAARMGDTLVSGSHEQLAMTISDRNIGKGRLNLTKEQKEEATRIIHPEMIRYGYPLEQNLTIPLQL